jgi:YegS/Rv2252/BmrU family lipid kinase
VTPVAPDVPERVAVIINPISGTGGRFAVARARADLARELLHAHGSAAEPAFTQRPGHARELALAALDRGASLVIAWGGDGTVNEVGSALAFRNASIGIVPSGSGNGLARELGIPLTPALALGVALEGRDALMDAGELDGRLFFNVAGLGLDARVAHEFAAHGLLRRGFSQYLKIAARELFTFVPDDHTIVADGAVIRTRALLIALANARQYGNGAIIAPDARLDDGELDVVVVAYRSPWAALRQVPKLFAGRITRAPGVSMRRARRIEITSARQVIYHVDGEPFVGGASITARVHPRALRVRMPALQEYAGGPEGR